MEGLETSGTNFPNNSYVSALESLFQIKIETPDTIDQSPFANLKIRICIDVNLLKGRTTISLLPYGEQKHANNQCI